MNPGRRRVRIRWTGCVQGIGLRPALARLATRHGLHGHVANTADAVEWEWEGAGASIADAMSALSDLDIPGLRVDTDVREECTPSPRGETGFAIRALDHGQPTGWCLPPDLAPCDDCLAEMRDPNARRWRYPFLSCTRCGPRWTTATALPWTRAHTTFARFPPCPACQAEFELPSDRRFHAETIACPACGPRASWTESNGSSATGDDAVRAAERVLRCGGVVAVLGVGGFHLCVDARSEAAVRRLRERKRRPTKPLAVLFRSIRAAMEYSTITPVEENAMRDPSRPIVLVRGLPGGTLADAVAPGISTVGALLPPTPLHQLLADDLDFPLVCTSGNGSGEPTIWEVDQGMRRLAGVADGFLIHDRPIAAPADDAVVRVIDDAPVVLRHGRGTAPIALPLPAAVPPAHAWGGVLKAAPAVARGDRALLGPHVADLDSVDAIEAHRRTLDRLAAFEGNTPAAVQLHDAHPESPGARLARDAGGPTLAILHHGAHAAALAAEHGFEGAMVAVAWDGAGYGGDDTVHGGEFLVRSAGTAPWVRATHLPRFRLPGGDAAARDPRRCAYALLHAWSGPNIADRWAGEAGIDAQEAARWRALVESGVASPSTTSAGRWFDAVAALLGIAYDNQCEGEAAQKLEAAADRACADAPLPDFAVDPHGNVDPRTTLEAIWTSRARGVAQESLAAGFHAALGRLIVDIARRIDVPVVGLTGGCFANRRLAETTARGLRAAGRTVLLHRRVPPGDGGLAYGQIAAWVATGGNHVPGDSGTA